ncbi:hypothetical protein OE88DRAFT_530713 [Heliocybe sulcata]|uniref:Uncharacterized protein n=1 Tax=Heliocybe sulcata TaxID=5364 RepID=A0A5C3MSN7_9AGAM|nr:hypothetical protein OE88DRAFT_530713 [Heliocybe sulcata]
MAPRLYKGVGQMGGVSHGRETAWADVQVQMADLYSIGCYSGRHSTQKRGKPNLRQRGLGLYMIGALPLDRPRSIRAWASPDQSSTNVIYTLLRARVFVSTARLADALAVCSTPSTMLAMYPSLTPAPLKRPRGIWKARSAQPAVPAFAFSQAVFGPLRLAVVHSSDTDDTHDSHDDEYEDDDDDDVRSWTSGSSKRRRCSGHYEGAFEPCRGPEPRPRPASTEDNNEGYSGRATPETMSTLSSTTRVGGDYEAWEKLKDDFARAAERYETDDIAGTLPILRQVLTECHKFLMQYDDPSVLYTAETTADDATPNLFTPTEERLARDWGFSNEEDGFFSRPITSQR